MLNISTINSVISQKRKICLNYCIQNLSTAPKSSSKKKYIPRNPNHLKFGKDRKVFNSQMNGLRRQWQGDIKAKQELLNQQSVADRQRIVAIQAMKLREKRSKAKSTQDILNQQRLDQRRAYEEKLAHSILKKEVSEKERMWRYKQLIDDLQSESVAWITPDNFQAKITPEFFERPSSTGLITPYTPYWKTQVLSFSLNRVMSPELEQQLAPDETDALLEQADKGKVVEVMIESFLEGFVSSGEDRLMLKDAVRELTKAHGVTLYDDYDDDVEDEDEYYDEEEEEETSNTRANMNQYEDDDEEALFGDASRKYELQQFRQLDILHSKGMDVAGAMSDIMQEEETIFGEDVIPDASLATLREKYDTDDDAIEAVGDFTDEDDNIFIATDADEDNFDKFDNPDEAPLNKKELDKKKSMKRKESVVTGKKKGKK